MFEKIFKAHNPTEVESFGIIKFYSERLSEDHLIILIQELFDNGSNYLPTELSKSSFSESVQISTRNKFEKIFSDWIIERLVHSSKLTANRDSLLTNQLRITFIDFILAIKNIGFSIKLKQSLKEFILKNNKSLNQKYFRSAFDSFVQDSNIDSLETIGFFLFSLVGANHDERKNIDDTIHYYLKSLAFSTFIFDLNDDLLGKISGYIEYLLSKKHHDKNTLISLLLSEIITTKKLDLEDFEHENFINEELKKFEVDSLVENLDLLEFLDRFNYNFENYDFESKLLKTLEYLTFEERLDSNSLDRIYHINKIIKESKAINRYLIFLLERISKENIVAKMKLVFDCINETKIEFFKFPGFEEFETFQTIRGEKKRKVKNGYLVKIFDEGIINNASLFISNFDLTEYELNDIKKYQFGFLSKFSLQKVRGVKNIKKVDIENPNLEHYLFDKLNYSPLNKGQIFTLIPDGDDLRDFINQFGISHLFGILNLWILEQAAIYSKYKKIESSPELISISKFFGYEFGKIKNKIFFDDELVALLESNNPLIFKNIIKRSQQESLNFEKIRLHFSSNDSLKSMITERKSGGYLTVLYGLEGFLPGSLLDLSFFGHSHENDSIIGSEIEFKIISIDEKNNKFIISNRALTDELRKIEKIKIFEILERGLVLEGTVKNITSYGVFVDLGGIDGLIHITDLSWSRITHTKEIVELDQKINVVVLDFDEEKSRIALGLKQLVPHPWDTLDPEIKIGSKINGRVVSITDFGAFVETVTGVTGLIHVSEMSSTKYINHVQDFLAVDDQVEAVILSLDREDRKMALGMRQLIEDPLHTGEDNNIGTVKFFNKTKGFGFIRPKNGGSDVFVHCNGLIHQINKNDKVSFELKNGKKGVSAINVKVIS